MIRLGIACAGAWLLVGCGPNCQSTCQRIYDPNECGIAVPGESWQESSRRCADSCEDALDRPGEVGDYNPFEHQTGGASAELENEKQAALWMDCVEATQCEDIDDGVCAPI